VRAVILACLAALICTGLARAGGVPVQVAAAGTTLWTASDAGLEVVDLHSGRIVAFPRTTYPYAMQAVVGGRAVWVASITNGYLSGAVDRIDLKSLRRTTPLRFPQRAVYAISFGGRTLWTWLGAPTEARRSLIARVDASGRGRHLVRLQERPGWMAATQSGLWLSDGTGLEFLGRTSKHVVRIARVVVTGPLAVGLGGVWVISHDRIVRFGERTKRESLRIRIAGGPILLAAGGGRLWAVTMRNDRSRLLSIDAARHVVVRSRMLSFVPTDMRFAAGRLWLGASAPPIVYGLDPRSLRTLRRIPLAP
jgi:hypothetical protein